MKYIKLFKHYNESLDEEIDEISYKYGIELNINIDIKNYIQSAIDEFLSITPFWDNVEVVYVKSLRNKNIVGLYRSSTATSTPVVMIDQKVLLTNSKLYNVSVETTAKTTIWHEIGHAIVELDRDLELNKLHFNNEEDFVEDISYEMFKYGAVPSEIEEFYDYYSKM
jgi:hypothetical protein